MRQLLDHAAENSYGIPAFNVNNLNRCRPSWPPLTKGRAVILQPRPAPASTPVSLHQAPDPGRHRGLSAHPPGHAPDHGTSPKVCQGAIDLGFGSVMMDGSLMEDGKSSASFDYNVEVTRRSSMAHAVGVTVEGELGCLGNLETGEAGEEDGIGAEGKLDHSQMLTDPEEAAVFVKATQLDALAIAIGTSHGAYKFSRKPTGDILAIARQGNPQAHPEHPPGDARLVVGAARSAGHHQPVRRQDEGNLRRARRGDPGSHQARRPQDQHRHRHPPGDDWRGAFLAEYPDKF